MKKTQKKLIFNIIMCVLIAAVVFAGVMVVGNVRGWFSADSVVAISDKLGSVNIERQGIAYSLTKGTALTDGDSIETLDGSTATLEMNQIGILTMAGNTRTVYHEGSDGKSSVEVIAGEVFISVKAQNSGAMVVSAQDRTMTASDAVFSLSAPSGSQNVFVFSGCVSFSGDNLSGETSAKAGEAAMLLTGTSGETVCTVSTLGATSLNEFQIAQVNAANATSQLCFTNDELNKVVADRHAEMLAMEAERQEKVAQLIAQGGNVVIPVENADASESTSTQTGAKDVSSNGGNSSSDKNSSSSDTSSNEDAQPAPTAGDGQTNDLQPAPTATQTPEPTPKPTEKPTIYTCTISIRCDTILDNMENLTEGKAQYVPSNGSILSSSSVQFYEGETVFDVLKRTCDAAGIQIEYSYFPIYESYYIEGMNHLYEFDCGAESGWMYKVNGWFPNYGCSAYTLEDGDTIVWCYTCNGLGADVGGSVY